MESKTVNQKLSLVFKGCDSWSRPVYECNERLYVDVDPRSHQAPQICTKYNNEFDGEPDNPISEGTEIDFIPARQVWR